MAKANTGIKQDWKSRSTRRKGTKRTPIAGLLALVAVALIGVLVYFLNYSKQPNTFFLISDRVKYDFSVDMLPRVSLMSKLNDAYEENPKRLKTSSFELSKDTDLFPSNLAIGPEDTLIVYLHAHLVHDSQANVDTVYVANSNFLSSGSINWTASGVVNLSDILDQIQETECNQKLLILDAGSLTTHGRLRITVNRFATALDKIVAAMDSKHDNLFILLSHSDGQQSNSAAPNRNTIFTKAVEEAFLYDYQAEDGEDLTLEELYRHVCYRIEDWLGPQGTQLQTPILMQGSKGTLSKFPIDDVSLVNYSDSLLPENKDDTEEKEEAEQSEQTMKRDRPEHNNTKVANTKIALTQFMSPRSLLINQPTSLLAQAEPVAPVAPAPAEPVIPAPAAEPMANAETKETEPTFDDKAKALKGVWIQIHNLRNRILEGDTIQWTPVDFGPQDLRDLESYVMGLEQRLLHETEETDQDSIGLLKSMEAKLAGLQAAIAKNEKYQFVDNSNSGSLDVLISTWNAFQVIPSSNEWTKRVDPQTHKIRLGILQLGDYAYEAPGLIRSYELSLASSGTQPVGGYDAIREFLLELCRAKKQLHALHAVDPRATINEETQAKPFLDSISIIEGDLKKIHVTRTTNIRNSLTTLKEHLSNNKAEGPWDANFDFELLNGLRASLANSQLDPENRYQILSALHEFSQLMPPLFSSHTSGSAFKFPATINPFTANEPKSLAKLHLLQQCLRIPETTSIEAEALGIDSKIDAMQGPDAIEKELLAYYLAADKKSNDLKRSKLTSDQFNYQMLVRTHHSNGTNPVEPFDLQFKDLVVESSLEIIPSSQNLQLDLLQIGTGLPFTLELKAQEFVIPPDGLDPVEKIQLEYDSKVFDVKFPNDKFDPIEQELTIRIKKKDGPITIKGTVSAKIDREAYALSKDNENLESATVVFSFLNFPTKSVLNCNLPWANEIELAVQQTDSTDTGLFFGNRIQLSMFPNRPSGFSLKLVNRSSLPKTVTATLYPVVRPPSSTMPPGRIFSYEYHYKSKEEQQKELAQWLRVTLERTPLPQSLGATAQPITIPPYKHQPIGEKAPFTSPASGDPQIIHEALGEPINAAQVVPLILTLSPAAEGEKPAPIDISNGMVCVIEEVGNSGKKWIKWIEYKTRHPRDYLEPTVKVVEVDGLNKLEITINSQANNPPRPSWNLGKQLHGFANLPAVSPEMPHTILWDWKGHFAFERSPAIGSILNPRDKAVIESPDELISSDIDDWHPILLSVKDHPEYSTWERVFRYQINLRDQADNIEIPEFHGYQHLAITSVSNVLNPAPESGLPIPTIATNLNKQNQSPLLFPLSKVLIAQVSVSAPNDSFTLAEEKTPDFIQMGLVEPGESLDTVQSRLTTKFYGKRDSQVHLLAAKPTGILELKSLISDHQLSLSQIDTKINGSFRKDLVVSLRAGSSEKSIEARVPIIVDDEQPEVLFTKKSLSAPVNKTLSIEIPCVDKFSGISHITIGMPDQKKGLLPMPVPQPVIVAEGNVTAASIDKPRKVFIFQLNPMEFMWKELQSYELRILAYDKVGLVSEPIDFVVKVTEPVMDKPEKKELVIQVNLVYAFNGEDINLVDLAKFQTTIEGIPAQATIKDGVLIFKSADFDPAKVYTINSSGRGTSGLLMGELKLKAESADQVKTVDLKLGS